MKKIIFTYKRDFPKKEMELFELLLSKPVSYCIYLKDTKEKFFYDSEFYKGHYRVVTK